MNKQNLQIAAQAGLQQRIDNPNEIWGYRADLERFAELVRQDEREACARTCDNFSEGLVGDDVSGATGAGYCANAIRAKVDHEQD
jgi:hypothetical protein